MLNRIRRSLRPLIISAYLQITFCLLYWILIGTGVIRPQGMPVNVIIGVLFFLSIFGVLSGTAIQRFYIRSIQEDTDNLKALNESLRRQRHEYMNEMQIVYSLMELGEYEEAFRFLQPVYRETARTGRALKTAFPAVNALIMNKMDKAQQLGIEFVTEISTSLLETAVDDWSLCKVLGNLLDNAMTAALKAGSSPEVHLILSRDRYFSEICVYNNGPVIPENQFEVIFRNGFTSKSGEGHGFGLGIVKDIVKEAGGEILVNSRSGKTSFTVNLPVRETQA
jgi:sensor histidine kinase regulating citrate/malate metabolism